MMSRKNDMGIADQKLRDLLEDLAAKTPTPGGGAVAGAVGALAGALGRMALEYSRGPKVAEGDRARVTDAIAELARLSEEMIALGEADAEAYARLNQLQKLDADHPERKANWDAAVSRAVAVPRSVMDAGQSMLIQLESMVSLCNRWLRSDLAIAALLAETSIEAAAWNVEVNLSLIENEKNRETIAREVSRIRADAETRARRVTGGCRDHD